MFNLNLRQRVYDLERGHERGMQNWRDHRFRIKTIEEELKALRTRLDDYELEREQERIAAEEAEANALGAEAVSLLNAIDHVSEPTGVERATAEFLRKLVSP